MRQLKEPCRSAVASGRCKGCVGLAEPDWEEPSKCPYLLNTNESIEQIHLNLRNGEEMSRFLTRRKDGTYLEEIESMNECKWRINGMCCNDSSKYLGDCCYHAEIKPPCFEKEDGKIEGENK